MDNLLKLGVNQDVIDVDTSTELRSHIVNMVSQANKTIYITSRKMDARLTNHSDFLDAIRSGIAKNTNFDLKILIYQLDEFLSENHQILDLSHRLSTNISIKVFSKEQQHCNHDFILVDNMGVIYSELADRYESIIEYNNKRRNQELTRQFNEAWEHGVRDSNLYRLNI
ncbi:MAG: hypothetical protein ACC657_04450 [Thiohalomonadales bacterium]